MAQHLVMASRLIEADPELAHRHATSAARRAGRIGVVRETLAITAYATGDFALALRELRTYRRISGSNDQLPMMVDSERGVGRPDRALELGRSVDRATLPADVQVSLAIAMSGARLDLEQPEAALAELEIPQLDPNRAYSWSPDLFHAYAEVLEELGRGNEAESWRERARFADEALAEAHSVDEHETIHVIEEEIILDAGDSPTAVIDEEIVDESDLPAAVVEEKIVLEPGDLSAAALEAEVDELLADEDEGEDAPDEETDLDGQDAESGFIATDTDEDGAQAGDAAESRDAAARVADGSEEKGEPDDGAVSTER
ncbi:hypothetical protein [Leifsonia sp. LS1]|uniref:hypothetical protein n=1 Tax=Leifsonia sp. LS1 TaxID=2828483 RepID=UPI001CFDC8AF|nr:hypothetical protein [Leifsonia sp. LS1]